MAIVLGLWLVVGLSASILALLIYRAIMTPLPPRVLVVRADKDWQGAQITIEGGMLKQPQVATILEYGGYSVPFYLWPGQYTLRVVGKGFGTFSREVDLTETRTMFVDLTVIQATTQPGSEQSDIPSTSPSLQ